MNPYRSHGMVKHVGFLAIASLLLSASPAGGLSAATVARYGFEEGADGLEVNTVDTAGGANSLRVSGGPDASNDMVAFSRLASPNYTAAHVPATAFGNALAMEFDGSDDLYQPSPATSALATKVFHSFTIETYVRFSGVNFNAFQTLVGRDDAGSPGLGVGPQSLFYLSKGSSGLNNAFRVELITANNTNLQINSGAVAVPGQWYHVAAVGNADTGTLRLYVDGTLVGETPGFTGLFNPGAARSWTIGRGQFAGKVVDLLHGCLDEVRFSDEALEPSQFLSAVPPTDGTVILISWLDTPRAGGTPWRLSAMPFEDGAIFEVGAAMPGQTNLHLERL